VGGLVRNQKNLKNGMKKARVKTGEVLLVEICRHKRARWTKKRKTAEVGENPKSSVFRKENDKKLGER